MASEWIEHVKKYAKENGIKYGDALKKASATFRKSVSAAVTEVPLPVKKESKSKKSRGSKKRRTSRRR
jgi:hypothetical protein